MGGLRHEDICLFRTGVPVWTADAGLELALSDALLRPLHHHATGDCLDAFLSLSLSVPLYFAGSLSLCLSTFSFNLRVNYIDFSVAVFYSIFSHFWSRSPCILQQPQSVFQGAQFCRF